MPFRFSPKKYLKTIVVLVALLCAFAGGIYVRHSEPLWQSVSQYLKKAWYWKKTLKTLKWDEKFKLINIELTGGKVQKAYFYKSESKDKKPLLVSLHTWSGDYSEYDALADLAAERNINYIHPDFMGPNNRPQACCSDQVIDAIDMAIDYAIKNANIDTSQIYITGASGGGYATLCMLMKSRHSINKFAAWVPVTDLEAWYYENKIRNNNFAYDILLCTNSGKELDRPRAAGRSPLKWKPERHNNLYNAEIYIYAGVYDGLQGSVPITHSINFYNKLLRDKNVGDSTRYVSDTEKAFLLEKRTGITPSAMISNRKILLKKNAENIQIIIFEGAHEMLPEYNLNTLLE